MLSTPSKPLITLGFWFVAIGSAIAAVVPPVLAATDQLATVTALDFSKWAVAAGAVGIGLIGVGKALWDVGHKLSVAMQSGTLPVPTDEGDAGDPRTPPAPTDG